MELRFGIPLNHLQVHFYHIFNILFVKDFIKFVVAACAFKDNFALESGGAIFFENLIPSTFKKELNEFSNNSAKFYGKDLATQPTKSRISLSNPNLTVQSGVRFNANFTIALADQYDQITIRPNVAVKK